MAYDNGGVNALKPKPSGGRIRENLTLKEERAFAKAAGAGEHLNVQDLKAAYEKAIGHIGHPAHLGELDEGGRIEARALARHAAGKKPPRAQKNSPCNRGFFFASPPTRADAGADCSNMVGAMGGTLDHPERDRSTTLRLMFGLISGTSGDRPVIEAISSSSGEFPLQAR
jgi:hypothetical protein